MHFDTLVHLRDHSKWTGLYRLLLIEIELFAHGTSHTAYPSVETLAAHLGKTPRHTQMLLRTLITAGAVKVVRGTGRTHTNTYQLCDLPTPQEPERVNSTSPLCQERVNSSPRKGEIGDTERVKSTSPEVVVEKERKERDVFSLGEREETTDLKVGNIVGDPPLSHQFVQFNGTYGRCLQCGELTQAGICAGRADAWAAD